MEHILGSIGGHGYLILLVVLIGEGMGLPIPGEPALMIAGALAATGRMHPVLTFLISWSALLIGDSTVFFLGRWVGRRNRERAISVYAKWLGCTMLSESCHARARRRFTQFSPRSLLWIRFVPGARVFAPPLAGMSGLRYPGFLLYSGVGTLFWASCFLALGYALPAQIQMISDLLNRSRSGLAWLVILSIIFTALFRAYRLRRKDRARPGILTCRDQGRTDQAIDSCRENRDGMIPMPPRKGNVRL